MANLVIFGGNLGADPELRFTGSGTAVCNLRVASNRVYRNSVGNEVKEVTWMNVAVFGKNAEACAKYLQKGSRVQVTGRLQTRQWEDKDGNKRSTTEIVAERPIEFLGKIRSKEEVAADADEAAPAEDGFVPDETEVFA